MEPIEEATEDCQVTLDEELFEECDNVFHDGGRPSEVERLVKLGANGSGYKNPHFKATALISAAWHNNIACVKCMIAKMTKDELLHQNKDGDTALHIACRWGHADIVALLLKHLDREGVELKNYFNKPAKQYARELGYTECVEVFNKNGY